MAERPQPRAEVLIRYDEDYMFFEFASQDARAAVAQLMAPYSEPMFEGRAVRLSRLYNPHALATWLAAEVGGIVEPLRPSVARELETWRISTNT